MPSPTEDLRHHLRDIAKKYQYESITEEKVIQGSASKIYFRRLVNIPVMVGHTPRQSIDVAETQPHNLAVSADLGLLDRATQVRSLIKAKQVPTDFIAVCIGHSSQDGIEIFFQGNSDLDDFIRANKNTFELETVKDLMRQMILMLEDLHIRDIAHTDYKPKNIWVHEHNGRLHLKLGDQRECLAVDAQGKLLDAKADVAASIGYAPPGFSGKKAHTYNLKACDCHALVMSFIGTSLSQDGWIGSTEQHFPGVLDLAKMEEKELAAHKDILRRLIDSEDPEKIKTTIEQIKTEPFFLAADEKPEETFARVRQNAHEFTIHINEQTVVHTEPDDFSSLIIPEVQKIYRSARQIAEEIDRIAIAAKENISLSKLAAQLKTLKSRIFEAAAGNDEKIEKILLISEEINRLPKHIKTNPLIQNLPEKILSAADNLEQILISKLISTVNNAINKYFEACGFNKKGFFCCFSFAGGSFHGRTGKKRAFDLQNTLGRMVINGKSFSEIFNYIDTIAIENSWPTEKLSLSTFLKQEIHFANGEIVAPVPPPPSLDK